LEISRENFCALVAARQGNKELEVNLQELLTSATPADEFFRRMQKSEVLDDGHVLLANADGYSRTFTGSVTKAGDPLWLDVGCVSKLITATTMLKVFGVGGAVLKTRLVDVLDMDYPDWFSAITLNDLLNHTHGIDEPQRITVKTSADGTIDPRAILDMMGPKPIHEPGKLYSYACVGPWLLAAVLEKKLGERYMDIVRQVLPSILPPHGKDDTLCPALGAGIRINAGELLHSLVSETTFAKASASRVVRLGPALCVRYPGWHPHEHAVCSGWKAYDNGWYGHQAILTKTPLILRVSPAEGFGVLVSSQSIHPWRIIDALCAKHLIPDPRPPKSGARSTGPGHHDSGGLYERVDSRIEILADKTGLRMIATSMSAGEPQTDPPVQSSPLRPIGPQTFGVSWSHGDDNVNTFFEFIRNADGAITHLWNGGLLWKRVS
jgi:hypothetical protein